MRRWRSVPLGEAIELAYGKSLPREARTIGGKVPVYGSNGIAGWHDFALVNEPTVIVGRKGSAGAVQFVEVPCYPIDTTYFVRVRAGFAFDIKFLFYLLRKLDLSRLKTATGVPGLTREDAYQETIPVPPLPEQRRVVDLLSRAEGIVRLRREAEKKASELIPALFLDMFGDPATNPMGWPRYQLDEVLRSIDSGQSPKCHDRPKQADEWGVLRLSAITSCDYKEDEHKTLPKEIQPNQAVEIRAEDVLLSRKNTYELVGASVYVWKTQGKMLLPDLIFRLNIADRERLHPIFLWSLLTMPSKRAQVRKLASGSAGSMPNIAKSRLRTLDIEVPPYEAQTHFAGAVEQARSIQSQQSAATAKAQATLDALLARTFASS